jgi:hypothetical protein
MGIYDRIPGIRAKAVPQSVTIYGRRAALPDTVYLGILGRTGEFVQNTSRLVGI